MKTFINELLISATMTAALAVLVCGVYPIAVFAMAQGLFPGKANGSILYQNGTAIGSVLSGQNFESPQYFHSRPSVAGSGYDGMASGGSNLGPTSKDLMDKVQERVKKYREENALPEDAPVPVDAVTASGSGLDPHIRVENALLQAARVAKARGWDVGRVNALVRLHTEARTLSVLGEPRVNVLLLNLALDQKAKNGK